VILGIYGKNTFFEVESIGTVYIYDIVGRQVLEEMKTRAAGLGANAIIGVKMDYEVLGADNGMLMVTCSGTAVIVG